jgi:hypothetical protein
VIEAAKANRWGHRDATMILLSFRHGLHAERAAASAGLEPKAHPHMLRHACGQPANQRQQDGGGGARSAAPVGRAPPPPPPSTPIATGVTSPECCQLDMPKPCKKGGVNAVGGQISCTAARF